MNLVRYCHLVVNCGKKMLCDLCACWVCVSGFKLNWDVAEKELFFDFKLKNKLSHKTYSPKT